MKAFVRMLKRRVEAAAIWRQENREQSQSNREPQMADCGWVLFYRGEICGWTRDLHPNTAQGWQPGVLAVGVAGIDDPIYQATGGDEMHGATGWSSIWNPAFFERNQVELKTTLDAVLKKLLAPDGNPTHAPTK